MHNPLNDVTYSDELLDDDEFMAKWHGAETAHLDYHHAQYIERRVETIINASQQRVMQEEYDAGMHRAQLEQAACTYFDYEPWSAYTE